MEGSFVSESLEKKRFLGIEMTQSLFLRLPDAVNSSKTSPETIRSGEHRVVPGHSLMPGNSLSRSPDDVLSFPYQSENEL